MDAIPVCPSPGDLALGVVRFTYDECLVSAITAAVQLRRQSAEPRADACMAATGVVTE